MGRVVLYTVIQVPVMIIAALALAMLIDSYIVKHITAFRLSYFLPYAIPGVVASIIWVYLYNGQISPIVRNGLQCGEEDQHVVAGEGPGRDVGHRAEDHIVAEEVHLDADGGKSLNDSGNLAVVEVHPDDDCNNKNGEDGGRQACR